MRDDAWWDGEDDEHIAALQRELAPLREPPAPWGDVHARVRFGTVPQSRASAGRRVLAAALAAAAAMALGWWFGRGDAQRATIEPTPAPALESVPVAHPQSGEREPVAPPLVVPIPVPVVAADEAVATEARRELLGRQFARLNEHKKARAAGRTSPEQDEAAENVEAAARASDLPERPTAQDVKDALAKLKGAAKACGVQHGATPGETVKIKLSIAGATGRVTSSTAQSPHAGTELGRCVAEVLADARFPRFRKPSIGVVYPVVM